METLTFDKLPQAVTLLCEEVRDLKKMFESLNNSQSNKDEILTIQEAGAYLNLSVPTMYGLTQRSEVPFMKKSKRLYFSKSQLLEWLHTGKRKTLAETSKEANNYLKSKKG